MSKILNDLVNLWVPRRCFGCNAHLYRGERYLCAFCRHEMPLTEYNFGKENDIDRKLYGRCRFEKAVSLLYFERTGLAQTLIHALKYRRIEPIGKFLGTWMGASLVQDPELPKIDWVIPVPLHPVKQRKRGYNQCALFGKTLAGILQANWGENYLLRKGTGRSQTKENRGLRARNAQAAFQGENLDQLGNKSVLLVDDVITTGATLEACCLALSETSGKPPRIYIATMAAVL
ncbi:comF family protein [Robiginitalea myxolifaciens]|uniref:ComF family protein n=2 Tax=Robiginitalea myxolifaciens TaxID=400055 RepID=A0A1I6G6U1_9FLAO|nr:comF family protein [Robiginitalea myxolifaciens]